jgi:hypothetical protein
VQTVLGKYFLNSSIKKLKVIALYLKNLVQEYRAVHFGAGRHNLPKEEEYEKWKKQIPVWVETNKIVPPEDL